MLSGKIVVHVRRELCLATVRFDMRVRLGILGLTQRVRCSLRQREHGWTADRIAPLGGDWIEAY